ncbi:MAG TPA: hypothetical protein VK601_20455 [Kofleriaceae bacterium]|nr:hypothetical protein [Kofleriaceae bacterium]
MIDLGGEARGGDVAHRLHTAIIGAGFSPVLGDGVDDALAGRDVERDAVVLSSELAAAERAFGALACGEVIPAARQAIGIAAARQAGGRPVPELPRALAYVLLCADRDGQLDDAATAAVQLRALGGSPDVPAAVWAKYPDFDALANPAQVELEVDADVAGASVWIDFRPIGPAPVRVTVAVGEHVIAAAAGSRRGWAAGDAIPSQRSIKLPLTDTAGPWADVARHVAAWGRAVPPPAELGFVLARTHARIALVRHGDTIEAWGRVGLSEAPHLIGDDDGVAPISDVPRVLALIADRIASWNAHAPDPDRPLLVEDPGVRGARRDEAATPTKWWVYAAIGGALAVAATVLVVHEAAGDHQRVELNYP